jgi:hypothetical protein
MRLRNIEDYDLSRHDTVTFYRYAHYHFCEGGFLFLDAGSSFIQYVFMSEAIYLWRNKIPLYWVLLMCIDWTIFTKIVTFE